jgi:hypothetical protein
MGDPVSMISTFADAAGGLLAHRFDVVVALDDGTAIPPEALSEDHTIGIYGDVAPRKMREHVDGYRLASLQELRLQSRMTSTPEGWKTELFLEHAGLRGVRFRAEDLQYLEDGWWATISEVKYPAVTVLILAHLIQESVGESYVYLNDRLPMPLWIRSRPLESPNVEVQVAIQVRAGDRMRPTNIHTECSIEYGRRWVEAARSYYDPAVD